MNVAGGPSPGPYIFRCCRVGVVLAVYHSILGGNPASVGSRLQAVIAWQRTGNQVLEMMNQLLMVLAGPVTFESLKMGGWL